VATVPDKSIDLIVASQIRHFDISAEAEAEAEAEARAWSLTTSFHRRNVPLFVTCLLQNIKIWGTACSEETEMRETSS
jgi:hypothetical protein